LHALSHSHILYLAHCELHLWIFFVRHL
jgi:hypothetical protein